MLIIIVHFNNNVGVGAYRKRHLDPAGQQAPRAPRLQRQVRNAVSHDSPQPHDCSAQQLGQNNRDRGPEYEAPGQDEHQEEGHRHARVRTDIGQICYSEDI
jgi:hypothetical protein